MTSILQPCSAINESHQIMTHLDDCLMSVSTNHCSASDEIFRQPAHEIPHSGNTLRLHSGLRKKRLFVKAICPSIPEEEPSSTTPCVAGKQVSASSQPQKEATSQRILRLAQVMHLTGYRRASIYAKGCRQSRQFDPTFPQRISLSASGRGAVGWIEAELLAWLQLRADARTGSFTASSKASRASSHGSSIV